MILVLLSLMIIAVYTGVMICKTRGIPYSISATYYSLEHKYWFGACMIACAILLLPIALDVSTEDSQFLIFLSVVGMGMIGVSPNFREKTENVVHVSGATMTLVLSQIWVGCNSWYWLLLWVGFIVYMVVSMKKNWTGNFISVFIKRKPMFWIEVVSLLTVYLSCLI